MMDINKICPGCMKEVENRDSVGTCPHCGYSMRNATVESHQMRPFTILAGKYLIGKVIGEGGFGISYIGYDLNLELAVAIKEFYPAGFVTREANVTTTVTMFAGKNEADVTKWRDGFISEARSLARFSNLNGIVEVRDFFNENDTAYIVMEYIDGITLKNYLKQNGGKIPADQTFRMMEPVIRSLSKVHDTGMIHRDISPDNIMITKYGGMKLLDFGAAREFAGNAEKSLSIMLKPGYAPEEQYRSRGNQGPWSDVYALSATIYKCITGITPVESMERMRADTLKMPKELGVNITDAQNEALRMGMAVYAEHRLQNMDALYNALYSGFAPSPGPGSDHVTGTGTGSDHVTGTGSGSDHVTGTGTGSDHVTGTGSGPDHVTGTGSGMTRSSVAGTGGSNKKVMLIGAAAACGIIFIGLVCVLISSMSKSPGDMAAGSKKADAVVSKEADGEGDAGGENTGGNALTIDDVKSLIANGQCEEAINRFAEGGFDDVEVLQEAVNGHFDQCVEASKSKARNGDIEGANSLADDAQRLFAEAAQKTGLEFDQQPKNFEQLRYEIKVEYAQPIYDEAQGFANIGDEIGMLRELEKLQGYVSDEDITRRREKFYKDLVLVNLNSKGSNAERMNYIDSNLQNAGNNGVLIEYWYTYSAMNGYIMSGAAAGINKIHKNGAGYIIPGSDSRPITYADLSGLTEYEVYFALFEIYARHGRTLSDPTMTRYFDGLGWYSALEKKDREQAFDERELTDIEKQNISMILDYQRAMGYR